MKKVVLLSGGIDSTTCLAFALLDTAPGEVLALNLYYGQRHAREMQSAEDVAAFYGVQLIALNLADIFQYSDCALLLQGKGEIPEESYSEQLKKTHGKPVSTYVPFRNGLMLAAAASIALSVGAGIVYYGAHADDAAGNAYPDCSVPFTNAMNEAIYEGSGGMVRVCAPFLTKNKAGVVKEGLRLGAPYRLTWSCYEGGEKPCGKCGTCLDRARAFEINGAIDPAL